MSRYPHTAKVPFHGFMAEVTYSWSPGRPARGPSYSSGGEPAEPAEGKLGKITIGGETIDSSELDENDYDLLYEKIMDEHEPDVPDDEPEGDD
jgi:hypothetical protein